MPLPPSTRALSPLARKYAVYEAVLRAGCSALFVALGTRFHDAQPFAYLYRDADLEGVSTSTGYLQHGRVVSVDDAQMGWSRCVSIALQRVPGGVARLSMTRPHPPTGFRGRAACSLAGTPSLSRSPLSIPTASMRQRRPRRPI